MALQKAPLTINFASGLDTKTDPKQVSPGRFLRLQNTVFTKGGLLAKRNGYEQLGSLPDTSSTFLTTFNDNLTAIGTSFLAYNQGADTWVNKGSMQPCKLATLPLIRSNTNQSQVDCAIASNGLVCTAYTDVNNSTNTYKYAIADSVSGQNIVAPTAIPVSSGAITGSPRVFLLGRYFVIVFSNTITGVVHLQYIAISVNSPTTVTANADISSQYTPANTVAFDGIVANNSLYLAWNGNDGGGAIRMAQLTSTLSIANTTSFAGRVATVMSLTADTSGANPIIYASFYNSASSTGYTLAVDQQLGTVLAPTQIITTGTILNITSQATAGVCTVYYEIDTTYSYGAVKTNIINVRTITEAGTLGTASTVVRSLGLASKAFTVSSVKYFIGVYSSTYQPTYFLVNGSGQVVSKLAYANAGPYYTRGLPSVTVNDTVAQVPYLVKDLVEAINKTQGAAQSAAVYSQTGLNLASFTIGTSNIVTAEIGNDLHLSGGFLWMYDGYSPVEHGFFLWPDNVAVTTATTGGSITDQLYYYIATYEWCDNQGNIFRSAGSVPVTVTTTGGNASTNTIKVPTLRLTYKTSNPVKIVVYRWSTAQQTYYQITSITAPTLNSTSSDSVTITDTAADSSIIGNNILYTTGGVIENIGAPACDTMTLYQSRLFLVDSEDKNLLWYSKQVIESVPVEMSDLLTIYVAPTTSAQGSTGPIAALSALDDKLIIFKADAIYYLNGTGPDNTGANSQFSEPVFITSTVGCDNQHSIVFMPDGLMFQSDKGIWLLGRDLSTSYIGAAVEDFTADATVLSAVNVPGTNQVRFTMDSGITLMYDYYFKQWGTFVNVPSISSTLYERQHTFINSYGKVYQEAPGTYLDGSSPVLIGFTTGWMNLAGLQGFERAYFFYLLGTYYSPHKLTIQIAYDYVSSPTQTSVISPDNYNPAFGMADGPYGSEGPYGGNSNIEQWRVFLQQQKCQAFQLIIDESFDATIGAPAGAGFTLSGIDLIVGSKGSYPRLRKSNTVG